MDYREFVNQYRTAGERIAPSGTGFLLLLLILVVSLLVPWGQEWTVMLLLGGAIALLSVSQWSEHRRWKLAKLCCGNCRLRLDRQSGFEVYESNRCPRCQQSAFEVPADVGRFVTVPIAEFRQADEAAGAGPGAPSNNPYAAPLGLEREAGPGGITLWQWPAVYVRSLLVSFRSLGSTRAGLIEHANRELLAAGGLPLDRGFHDAYIACLRRTAVWWLVWAWLLPWSAAVGVLARGDWRAPLAWAVAALVFAVGVAIGSVVYALSLGLGPRRWRNWWQGNPPPTRPVLDPQSQFFGIQVFLLGANSQRMRRPHVRFRFRQQQAAPFRVGLLNTASAVEFQVEMRGSGEAGNWCDDGVNFAVLLAPLESDFAGNRLRVLPQRDAAFELDELRVTFPEAEGG